MAWECLAEELADMFSMMSVFDRRAEYSVLRDEAQLLRDERAAKRTGPKRSFILTDEQKQEILASAETALVLANRFGVSDHAIYTLWRRNGVTGRRVTARPDAAERHREQKRESMRAARAMQSPEERARALAAEAARKRAKRAEQKKQKESTC